MKINFKKCLILGVILIVGYFIMKYIVPYFIPFILALVFSLLMEPMVRFCQRKLKLSRGISVAGVMIFGLGAIGFLISLLIFSLVSELIQLSYQLPKYQKSMEAFINSSVASAKDLYYVKLSPDLVTAIHENLGAVTESLKNFIVSIVNSFLSFVYTIPQGITGGVTVTVVSLLATFFISKDKDLLLKYWLKITPGKWGRHTLRIVQELIIAFSKYLKAQLILITITTILTITGLYIIDAEYALIMGLVTGLFDLIPVLGPSIVFIPWIIWCFLTGSSFFAIKLLILYALILTVRQVLETKVIADSLGLHPLATLLSMYLGLKIFGVLGMIAGPFFILAVQAAIKSGVISTIYTRK